MIQQIKAELAANPNTYNGLSHAEVVALLKAISITNTRQSISGSELFGYTDASEYVALLDVQKQQWLGLCGIASVTKDAVPLIKDLFPQGSITWANIIKTETKTPFINVQENEVLIARAQ